MIVSPTARGYPPAAIHNHKGGGFGMPSRELLAEVLRSYLDVLDELRATQDEAERDAKVPRYPLPAARRPADPPSATNRWYGHR